MSFIAINPATGERLRERPLSPPQEVEATLAAANEAFLSWRATSFSEREERLRRLAAVVRDHAREWAELMATEMGKPMGEAMAEIEKCAIGCEYYAENGAAFLAPQPARTEALKSYWTYRPLGVVLGIMPWNFPFWQVFRFAAPALMAGNAILVKHAPSVPGCAGAIGGAFRSAGFPEGLASMLFLDTAGTQALIGHPTVAAVSLTGSVRAGKAVAAAAGALIKKTVLELGGSDPYVVLEDADLASAAARCVTGRMINAGQSCIAAKRFIAVDSIYDEFAARVVEQMKLARMGDPLEEGTTLGPLAREDLRDTLHRQVVDSVEKGARCLVGGEIPERPGWWYPATVLADVAPGMAAYDEEVFGPVASLLRARDEEDALRIAADTSFGLGAAVFTTDLERGERIAAERLEAGNCFVNTFSRSHPQLPFGGIKESGYGRELSPLGILEFVNVKTVWVQAPDAS